MAEVIDFGTGLAQGEGAGVGDASSALLPAKKKVEKLIPWGVVNRLTENFYLIYGTDTVYDNETKRIMLIKNLRNIFGDAVKFWAQSPSRKMVLSDRVVFNPTAIGHVIDEEPTAYFDNEINLFYGLTTNPIKGDCSLIVAHLSRLCGGDMEVASWIMRWVAYPFQHAGAKMRTSVIMHGEEGTGKNIFWEDIVGKLYGQYGVVITQSQIESQFTGWIGQKLFAVADEVVSQAEKRHIKGRLKYYVTGGVVSINEKQMPERFEGNYMNFVFLSNEIQPLALDMGDRRYTVVWSDDVPDKAYFDALAKQIANGGLEAFYHYLKHLDLQGFNEHTKPHHNTARKDLIGLGLSPVRKFFNDWEAELLPIPLNACKASDLYKAFCKWCNENGERFVPSNTAFGREISRVIAKHENIKLYLGVSDWQGHAYVPIPPPPELTESRQIKNWLAEQVMDFAQKLTDWSK